MQKRLVLAGKTRSTLALVPERQQRPVQKRPAADCTLQEGRSFVPQAKTSGNIAASFFFDADRERERTKTWGEWADKKSKDPAKT